MSIGPETRSTDLLENWSESLPHILKKARLEACPTTVNTMTVEVSMPRLVSMYTLRNGSARLIAKLQDVRNTMRFLKLRSSNGFFSSAPNRGTL